VYVEMPNKGQPSGLGWLPDERMLIVSMLDRKLMVRELDGTLKEYADLSELAGWHCNDMITNSDGTCYVGNFGFDLHVSLGYSLRRKLHPKPALFPGQHEMREKGVEWALEHGPTANLIKVSYPDRKVSIAASGLKFPNGTQITPDGKTLIVGETLGMRLTAFDIEGNGDLSNRRVWAETPGIPPDGSCLDAEGAIWVANPFAPQVVRFEKGGKILSIVETSQPSFACMLGGEDRKTLYVVTAPDSDAGNRAAKAEGRLECARVDVAGAGLP